MALTGILDSPILIDWLSRDGGSMATVSLGTAPYPNDFAAIAASEFFAGVSTPTVTTGAFVLALLAAQK